MTQRHQDHLQRLRARIDNLDAALVHLLAERFALTDEVGRLKRAATLPPADHDREQAQIERLSHLAEVAGLPDGVIETVHPTITKIVRDRHRTVESDG